MTAVALSSTIWEPQFSSINALNLKTSSPNYTLGTKKAKPFPGASYLVVLCCLNSWLRQTRAKTGLRALSGGRRQLPGHEHTEQWTPLPRPAQPRGLLPGPATRPPEAHPCPARRGPRGKAVPAPEDTLLLLGLGSAPASALGAPRCSPPAPCCRAAAGILIAWTQMAAARTPGPRGGSAGSAGRGGSGTPPAHNSRKRRSSSGLFQTTSGQRGKEPPYVFKIR